MRRPPVAAPLRAGALLLLALACGACRSASLDEDTRARVDLKLAALADRTRSEEPALESEVLALADDLAVTSPPRHAVSLLHAGSDALTSRLHLLRAARRTVDIQTYIWGNDDSGLLIFAEALLAARRGVRVRLLVDQMGTRLSETLHNATLAHRNLSIRLYNPVAEASRTKTSELIATGVLGWARLNQRMHNKVMVVDGVAAIVGGRNIQDRYFGSDPTFDYIDRDALILGPVVAEVEASFDGYWQHPTAVPAEHLRDVGRKILALPDTPRAAPEIPPIPERLAWADALGQRSTWAEVAPHSLLFDDVERVDFEADPPGKKAPDDDEDPRDSLFELAEEYVVFQSNYLVFSQGSFRQLAARRESGRDLEVHFSTNSLAASGSFLVYGISRKQRFRMLHLGVQIHEMRPRPNDVGHFLKRLDALRLESAALSAPPEELEEGLILDDVPGPQVAIHAKSISIDGEIAVISSHNFDPRSEYHNTEASLAIYDERVCADLEGELELISRDGNSWRVGPADRVPVWAEVNLVAESISRELPIFDIWPWRYASCYELREGMEPVGMLDPRFHDHYLRVGQFPEVPFGWKDVKTRLISAFFGFTTSLM